MRLILVATMMGLSVGNAAADWAKIGEGPDLDYAKAYCDNASMGVHVPLPPRNNIIININPYGQTTYYRDPNEGWAQLGNGIGNLIRREKFKSNCMTMLGWGKVKNSKTSKSTKRGKQAGE
jgi:hypothetical protein